MRKKRITYGVSGMMEYQAVIKMGRSNMKVLFTDGSVTAYGVNPARYTTDSLMVQHAIENSEQFKRGRIYIVNEVDLDEEVKVMRNQPHVAVTAPNRAAEAGETTGEKVEPEDMEAEAETEREAGETDVAESEPVDVPEPEASTGEKALTAMEFDNNDDAKDFLATKFGVVRSKMRVRADIIAAGEANGIAISFS